MSESQKGAILSAFGLGALIVLAIVFISLGWQLGAIVLVLLVAAVAFVVGATTQEIADDIFYLEERQRERLKAGIVP